MAIRSLIALFAYQHVVAGCVLTTYKFIPRGTSEGHRMSGYPVHVCLSKQVWSVYNGYMLDLDHNDGALLRAQERLGLVSWILSVFVPES